MNAEPLVSIGVPTYNRAASLQRTIESALAQDYPNLELVISDNASLDETQSICTTYRSCDARVRYIRQTSNRGAEANFLEVLQQAQGHYFMWLADDDWIDPSYVSECVEILQAESDYSLVGGRPVYFENGKPAYEGRNINLRQASARKRVLAYFEQVADNAISYGVMRRDQLLKVPIQKTLVLTSINKR